MSENVSTAPAIRVLIVDDYPLARQGVQQYGYDGHPLIMITDALGGTVIHTYDAQERAQITIAPDGSATHTLYDVMGRVSATISAVGVTTDRTYAAAGRLVATTVQRPDDPVAVVTAYLYAAAGRQIATRTTAGEHIAESHTYYDAGGQSRLGRRVAVADALGRVTRTVYDAAGQLLHTVDPLGRPSGATARTSRRPSAASRALSPIPTML